MRNQSIFSFWVFGSVHTDSDKPEHKSAGTTWGHWKICNCYSVRSFMLQLWSYWN